MSSKISIEEIKLKVMANQNSFTHMMALKEISLLEDVPDSRYSREIILTLKTITKNCKWIEDVLKTKLEELH